MTDRIDARQSVVPAWLTAALDNLFLIAAGWYLVYYYLQMTMFSWRTLRGLEQSFYLGMQILLLARLMLNGFDRKKIIPGLAMLAVCIETQRSSGYTRALVLGLMVIGFADMDYRKILRFALAVVGGMLLATVLAGLSGGIQNLVYYRNGLRSTWGTAYPTDFAALVLFLAMIAWVAWPALPDWAMLLISIVPLLVAASVTQARNSVLITVLFILVVAYHWWENARLARRRRRPFAAKRWADRCMLWAFPFSACLSFLPVWLYALEPNGGMAGVNIAIFSDRLRLSLNALQTYPVTPFGMAINMHGGMGGTVIPKSMEYNFVDSSYIHYLLCYGWVTMLVIAVVWMWMTHRALRGGNRRMGMVMALIALHSVMEHHFCVVYYNLFLAMPLASIALGKAGSRRRSPAREDRVRYAAYGALTLILGAVGIPLLTWILSELRTLFDLPEGIAPAQGVTVLVAGLIIAAVIAMVRLLHCFLMNRANKLRPALQLGVCVLIGLVLVLQGNQRIDRAAADEACRQVVEADAPALSLISDVKIYSDTLPEIYRRRYPNIGRTVWGGEDLARIPGGTFLMDNDSEQRVLILSGFRYAEISPDHAIYTANDRVAEALTAGGYTVTDYYSTASEFDLVDYATKNALDMDDLGMLLDGPDDSLTAGPTVEAFSGNYVAEYALSLPEDALAAEGELCRLTIESPMTGMIAGTVVTADQFDPEGRAQITLPFVLYGDTADIRFQAVMFQEKRMRVEGIRYRRVGP